VNISVCFIIGIASLLTISFVHVRDLSPIYDSDNVFYNTAIGKQFRSEERLDKILSQFFDEGSFLYKSAKMAVTKVPFPAKNFFQAMYSHSKGGGSKGRTSFLFGKWYIDAGLWYYYIVVLLIKVPIAVLSFGLLSILFFKKTKSDIKNELFLIIPILAWLFVFTFVSKIDAGIRHIIFILPLVFIFSSKLINLRLKNESLQRISKVIFGLLCFWLVFANLSAYPHYISYFNEFVGMDNGYRYLGSDNIDIGQDNKHIKEYLDKNNIDKVKLYYHGIEKPEYRGVKYELIDCNPTKGNLVISAAVLQGAAYNGEYRDDGPDAKCFSWLYEQEPIDNIGRSILVYEIK
jgi:hypothetical protein